MHEHVWTGPWPKDLPHHSAGEVVSIETYDFQTMEPIPGGLFCPAIFGPEKGWWCRCRQGTATMAGTICERCGVEVTLERLRTEPLGCIHLVVPVRDPRVASDPEAKLGALPVLSPALRPSIQLDDRRFLQSDLNDLYRRVINRNYRLRRLSEIPAPPAILEHEAEMLQKAVNALLDNSRCEEPLPDPRGRPFRSLADLFTRLGYPGIPPPGSP